MVELETYDTMQVVKRQQENQRLKRALDTCRNGVDPTSQPTLPPHGESIVYLSLIPTGNNQMNKNDPGYVAVASFFSSLEISLQTESKWSS